MATFENLTEETLLSLGFNDPKRALANGKIICALSDGFDIKMEGIFNDCAASPQADESLNYLERTLSAFDEEVIAKFSKEDNGAALKKLITLCGSSPYLAEILIKNRVLTSENKSYSDELFFGGLLGEKKDTDDYIKDLNLLTGGLEKAGELNEQSLMDTLRRYKNIEYVRIGLRDLLFAATMEEITEEISDIAEASIEVALKFILRDLKKSFGAPLKEDPDTGELDGEAGFTVLAMGKFGGRELNFSSDIDIIYLYETSFGKSRGVEGKPQSQIGLHNYFTKVGNSLTKIIGAATVEGMVFRVDLDLRPEGHTGNVVNSLNAMETYYEAWGRSWERAAMIKVRPVGGSKTLGEEFLNMITPFSFRKYLDYTNIEEIRTMKEQIDLSLKQKNINGAVNVKLGRGGIREIEFFCQANQLVRGGKNKNLRTKKTLDTLKALYKDHIITEKEADILADCYIYLRNLEHRIQIVQGRQSQTLPVKKEELIRIAKMTGIKPTGQNDEVVRLFWEEYKLVTDKVYAIYETLFYSGKEELSGSVDKSFEAFLNKKATAEDFETILKGKGVTDTFDMAKDLILLRDGSPGLRLSLKALSSRDDLLPIIIQLSVESASPQKAIKHIERFFAATGSRINIYSMLKENLELLKILIVILSESTYLANVLIKAPQNIDTLLSSEKGKPLKTPEELKEELHVLVDNCDGNYEEILGAVRNFKNEEFFRIGLNDLSMANDFKQTSLEITNVADTLLNKAIEIAQDELRPAYGEPPSEDFFILGLGKYGSMELTYGSDLDIVFVFDAEEDALTDGKKKVTALQYFIKLGQKIINLLSTNTKEGIAFKVDAELRPSGSAGPLVTTRASLVDYQKDKAQFWERQSMTRLRVAAGNTEFGEEVKNDLIEIIFSKPVTGDDLKEVLRLRERMVVEIAKETGNSFDLKTGRGAMTDIEFVIQVLTLKMGKTKKTYTPFTMESLSNLEDKKMVTAEDAAALKDSYDFYKKLLSRLRIEHDKPEGKIFADSPELKSLALASGFTGKEEFLDKLKSTKELVREIFLKYMK